MRDREWEKRKFCFGRKWSHRRMEGICRLPHSLISSALFPDSVGLTVIYLMKVSERTHERL